MKPIEMNYKSGSNQYEVCYPQSQSDLILLSESARNTFGLGDGSTIDDALSNSIADHLIPIGSIFWYTSETIPLGCLLCDGSQVSRTDYSNLFNVIGVTFGTGDGSTTFTLPDLRASFIRGSGSQNGYNATFGQKQEATLFQGKDTTSDGGNIYSLNSISPKDKVSYQEATTRVGAQSGRMSGQVQFFSVRPYNTVLTPLIKY